MIDAGKAILLEGINKIAFERVKGDLVSQRKEYIITLDTINPTIVLGIPEYSDTNEEEFLIWGSLSEDTVEVTVNGDRALIGEFGSGFLKKVQLSNGQNTFIVRATDAAGNTTEKIVIVMKR